MIQSDQLSHIRYDYNDEVVDQVTNIASEPILARLLYQRHYDKSDIILKSYRDCY